MRKFLFDIESTGQLYHNKKDVNTFYLLTILGNIFSTNKFFLQHLVNKNNKSYERKTLSDTWNIYAQPSPS